MRNSIKVSVNRYLKLASGTVLFAALSTQAQSDFMDPGFGQSTPAVSTTEQAPRTELYGTVVKGNVAADNTVTDYTRLPHLIQSRQYIAGWGNGDLANAAFAFEGAGIGWFGLARTGAGEDELRAGAAFGDAFGAGVILALNRAHDEDTEVLQTDEGQGFGLFGSFNLGGSSVYGEAALYTGYGSLGDNDDGSVEVDGDVIESYSKVHVVAGWNLQAQGQGDHAMNAELVFDMSSGEVAGPPAYDPSLTEISFWFQHGYVLVQRDGFSVFAGSNTGFIYGSEEEASPGADDQDGLAFAVSPNMAFHRSLPKGFEVQAGISGTLAYLKGFVGNQGQDENLLITGGTTYPLATGADMSLGLRWQHENFAIEGVVEETLLSNGPQFIGGGSPGLFAQIGMSVGF